MRVALFGAGDQRIGVHALVRNRGLEPDGSFYYSAGGDIRGAIAEVAAGRDVFEAGAGLDLARLDRVQRMTEALARRGVQTVVFLPPLPAAVLSTMARHPERYAYVQELRREVARRFPGSFDFHEGRTFGSDDREFIDWLHGGDVTYLRMLRAMSDRPGSPVQQLVDVAAVQHRLDRYSGHAVIPLENEDH